MKGTLKQFAKAAFGHPLRAIEMAGIDDQSAIWIGFSVDAEQDLYDLAPVGVPSLGVEEPDIKLQMRLIIGGQCRAGWRLVEKVGLGHVIPRLRDVSRSEGFVNRDASGMMTQDLSLIHI